MPLKTVLWIVAVSQVVLGALTLFLPRDFAGWMGLSTPAADMGYLSAMLGARFLAYGAGLVFLARQAEPDRFWVRNMAAIQLIDLAAGAFYLATGTIGLATAAFPMVNATLFSGLLWFFSRPRSSVAANHP